METKKIWFLFALVALAAGCSNPGDDTASGRQNLGLCPEGVHPGMRCDAASDVACESEGLICYCAETASGDGRRIVCEEDGGPSEPPACTDESRARCEMGGEGVSCVEPDGSRCWCERTDDGAGHLRCEGPEPPPEPEACTVEHLDRCIAGERTECRYADGRICGCYPTDRGAEIFCVEPEPEVPACDDDTLRRCLDGETLECRYADGRICGCYHTDDGRIELLCDSEPPPPAPRECTEEDELRCADGEPVECVIGDRRCWCGETTEGSVGGLRCEEPPPAPRECTEEDELRCRAGEPVECVMGERRCWCGRADDGSDGGLTCEEPPPPPSHTCDMADYERCAAGENVRCERDGRACVCMLSGDGRGSIVCESDPPPPEPGGTGDVCTDEDAMRCAAGEPVECAREGLHCYCGEGGRLICG